MGCEVLVLFRAGVVVRPVLTPWQRRVVNLCWSCGTVRSDEDKKMYGRELERLKRMNSVAYEEAFEAWTADMYDILY